MTIFTLGSGAARSEPASNPDPEPSAPTAVPSTGPSTIPTTGPAAVPSSPEIEHLLTQFLSPSWKLREQAQDRLAALADAAEPRLRQFVATTNDAEARARAETALLQMASVRRLGPTLVSLHLREAAPQAVFAELSRQGHLPINPLRESLWQQTDKDHITLNAEDEPFWSVMRKACGEFGVRALFSGSDEEQGRIVLTRDPTGEMISPASFSGSFMLLATSLSRKTVFEGGEGSDTKADSDLTAEVTFFADPKWRIVEHPEQAVIESATDDKGNPLPVPEPMHMQAFKPENPIWLMRTDVRRVPRGCQKLARVKGRFRIVLLEESEPIEIPNILAVHNLMKKVAGRTLQVRETVKEGDGYKLKLTLFRNGLSTQDWRQQRESQGISLLDEKGRPLTRGGFNAEENGDQVDYELTFLKPDETNAQAGNAQGGNPQPANAPPGNAAGQGAPAKLVVQLPLEPKELTVPFEFKDLPIEK